MESTTSITQKAYPKEGMLNRASMLSSEASEFPKLQGETEQHD